VFAGSFVVATAGPDLESIIAGRGAGADVFSKEHSTTAANYDIGGGTSNYVMFGSGETICTSCLDIGGRLIKVDTKDHHVTYVAPKIAVLCETQGISIKVGERADEHKLAGIAGHMAQLLEMSLGLRPKSTFYPKILTLPDRDIEMADRLKNICFSGGVADYVYKDSSNEDVFRYGDIGILLGRAIRESTLLAKINRFEPRETIRATVVGAGAHITEISGSTIDYDPELLPIKNIPILKLSPEDEESVTAIKQAIESKIGWFNVKGEVQDVAISLTGQKSPSFAYIDALASAIVSGTKVMTDKGLPLVVVVEHDMAQVLGNTMRAKMTKRVPMICLDSIRVSNGDYIDIGTPAGAGTVLPVVVKTLVFS
jgi:ethanolamine utilization protein EutA